jgi:hypothetical protein
MLHSYPSSAIYQVRERERQEMLEFAARERLARQAVRERQPRSRHGAAVAPRRMLGAALIRVGEAVRGSLPRGMTTDLG